MIYILKYPVKCNHHAIPIRYKYLIHLSWYAIIVKSRCYKILHTDAAHDIHKIVKIVKW